MVLCLGKKDEEYRHLLGMFGVSSDLALRPIASLSGGQKSRLAFAMMAVPRCALIQLPFGTYLNYIQWTYWLGLSLLACRPNFLIFDEPTNHLDVETVDALGKALNKFPVRDITIYTWTTSRANSPSRDNRPVLEMSVCMWNHVWHYVMYSAGHIWRIEREKNRPVVTTRWACSTCQ